LALNTEQKAELILRPIIEAAGLKLWDVVFEKEGAYHYLRVLFEHEDGTLTIDECEELTPAINKAVDDEPFMQQVDVLDAGSPGLTRQLRKAEHYDYAVGKLVKAVVRQGGKTERVTGTLTDWDDKGFTINDEHIANADLVKLNLDL
jgi:ribosome maturation factor RimP